MLLQLEAAQADLSISQKLGEALQAQLEQAALETAALQARFAVAERASEELASTQQAAGEQTRELHTAQRAAERLGQQLQLADEERATAREAELQLRGRVAQLEVAVADEAMKAELQVSNDGMCCGRWVYLSDRHEWRQPKDVHCPTCLWQFGVLAGGIVVVLITNLGTHVFPGIQDSEPTTPAGSGATQGL